MSSAPAAPSPTMPRWTALSLGTVLFLSGCAGGDATDAGGEDRGTAVSSRVSEAPVPEDMTVSVGTVADADATIHTVGVSRDGSDERASAYDLGVQTAVDRALGELPEQGAGSEDPLMVLNPYGTNTTGLYTRFATNGDGRLEYTVTSDGHEDFTRTAKDHDADPAVFETQIVGLVPGAENTLTTTWHPENGQAVERTVTLTAPASRAGYPTRMDRDLRGDPEQLTDGMYLLSGAYHARPYGFLFDNAGSMRAELPLDGHMLDRFETYRDTLVYPVDERTLARVNGVGRVVDTYDLGRYEMHHDFTLTEDDRALILASDTSRDSVEDVLISLDLTTGEHREVVDFTELLAGYKDLTNPYEAPGSDGTITDDWLHLNSVDHHAGEDSVIVSGRENSTIIKVGDVHGEPRVEYLIGTDELWEGSGHEDDLLRKVGDFSDTGGQHTVIRHDDAEPEDGRYHLSIFDNSYWSVLSREDYTGPAPRDASTVSGTAEDENSFVRTYLVDENERTYSQVEAVDVPYSSIVSSAQQLDGNTVVNSGQAFELSERDAEDRVIATYSYEGERYMYRGVKYAFDDFWYDA